MKINLSTIAIKIRLTHPLIFFSFANVKSIPIKNNITFILDFYSSDSMIPREMIPIEIHTTSPKIQRRLKIYSNKSVLFITLFQERINDNLI